MDGNPVPSLPYSHTNISSAAATATSGDTIRVKSITWSGSVGAYAESSTNEVFPIPLKAGVTLEAYDVTLPVFVLSTVAGTTLFTVQEVMAPAPVTRLKDVRLLGALKAVELSTPTGNEIDAVIQNVIFHRNRIGLAVEAAGGHIRVAVDQCQIFDNGSNTPLPAPAAQNFQVGLGFKASRGVSTGRVDATIQSLTTAGQFNGMGLDPIVFLDLHGLGGASKLVSVELGAGVPEHPLQPNGDPFSRQAIPTVALTVNGGVWNGKAGPGARGWDIGLFAATAVGGGAIAQKDYYAAFEVEFNGVELRDFRESAIYAATMTESRGEIGLKGGSILRNTGSHLTSNPDDLRYSGATLISRESYLAFCCDQTEIVDNLGNGVLAFTPETLAVPVNYPQGLYLGLEDSGVHQNGLNGLMLVAAISKGQIMTLDHGAIVGGTWDDFPVSLVSGIRTLHMDAGDLLSKPMPELKQGEGFVNRCRISNNGKGTKAAARSGIRAEVYGNSYKDNKGADSRFGAVSASIVNSFLWNNPTGGFSGFLDHSTVGISWPGPSMLTPFVHTTVVGNGTQSGYNLEVVEVDGPGTGNYFYQDQNYALTFRVYDSIFERQSSADLDFGPYFTTNLSFPDSGSPGSVPPTRIGLAGLRSSQFGTYPSWTMTPTSFVGAPVSWTSLDPAQFFLAPGSPSGFIDACPNYLSVQAVWEEVAGDYSLDVRPIVFQDRDKGAEEF